MKASHVLYGVAALVLIADMVSGYQTAMSADGATVPSWYTNSLAKFDTLGGVPAWMLLAGVGAGLHFGLNK